MTDNYHDLSSNPVEDDENSFEKIQKKNERLQTLLIKAKATITQYKAKIDELEKELYSIQMKSNELQAVNNRLLKFDPPKTEYITETLCRVKVFDEIFCYVKSSKGNFWLSESYYKPKNNFPEIIDSSFTKKVIADQISLINSE